LKSLTGLDLASSSAVMRRAACWIGATPLERNKGDVVNADTDAVRVTHEIANVDIFMIPDQFKLSVKDLI
jgi:hypothetical protein